MVSISSDKLQTIMFQMSKADGTNTLLIGDKEVIDVNALITDYTNGKISLDEFIQNLTKAGILVLNTDGIISFEYQGKKYQLISNNPPAVNPPEEEPPVGAKNEEPKQFISDTLPLVKGFLEPDDNTNSTGEESTEGDEAAEVDDGETVPTDGTTTEESTNPTGGDSTEGDEGTEAGDGETVPTDGTATDDSTGISREGKDDTTGGNTVDMIMQGQILSAINLLKKNVISAQEFLEILDNASISYTRYGNYIKFIMNGETYEVELMYVNNEENIKKLEQIVASIDSGEKFDFEELIDTLKACGLTCNTNNNRIYFEYCGKSYSIFTTGERAGMQESKEEIQANNELILGYLNEYSQCTIDKKELINLLNEMGIRLFDGENGSVYVRYCDDVFKVDIVFDTYNYSDLSAKFSDAIINGYFKPIDPEAGKNSLYVLKDGMSYSMFEAELLSNAADLNFNIDTTNFPGWEANEDDSLNSKISKVGGKDKEYDLYEKAKAAGEEYLKTYLLPQLKSEFLSKYQEVLLQVGYSEDQILSLFYNFYNSAKSDFINAMDELGYFKDGEAHFTYSTDTETEFYVFDIKAGSYRCNIKPQALVNSVVSNFSKLVKDFVVDEIMVRKYDIDTDVLLEILELIYSPEELETLKELMGDDPKAFAELIKEMTFAMNRPMEEMMLPGQVSAFCELLAESNLTFNLDNFIAVYAQFKGIEVADIGIGDMQVINMLYAIICDKVSGSDEAKLGELLASSRTFRDIIGTIEGVQTKGISVDFKYDTEKFFMTCCKDMLKSWTIKNFAKPFVAAGLTALGVSAGWAAVAAGAIVFVIDVAWEIREQYLLAKEEKKDFTEEDVLNIIVGKCFGKLLGDFGKKIPAKILEKSINASVITVLLNKNLHLETGLEECAACVTKNLAKALKIKLDIDEKDDTSDVPNFGSKKNNGTGGAGDGKGSTGTGDAGGGKGSTGTGGTGSSSHKESITYTPFFHSDGSLADDIYWGSDGNLYYYDGENFYLLPSCNL